ncbi:hypothetical protein [Mycobacterium ostraviense]|uniref:hypothetical protein n=1 Tax=Mycobacterium ostraviense TaxID=2738409 RepID=UPI001E4EC8AF|nr:hypothetical protein [Mycobacterium ostraviense]UGT91878.1 hypothetical protein LTS72_27995 [Mycobacterium ostraviense]
MSTVRATTMTVSAGRWCLPVRSLRRHDSSQATAAGAADPRGTMSRACHSPHSAAQATTTTAGPVTSGGHTALDNRRHPSAMPTAISRTATALT